MLLRSQIAEILLARGARLVVCSPNSNEPYFRKEFSHPRITLEPLLGRLSRIEANLTNIRQYLLMNPDLGATLNYKNEAFRRQAPLRSLVARSGNIVLGRVPALRRAYMRLEERLFPGGEFDALLTKHCPRLVVTGTPGFNALDAHLLRAAKRLAIPTATVMLSWDNLTSKGYMNGLPDHLLVWSDLMAAEAVQFHDYPRDRILWTGAAQFDVYHAHRTNFDRQAWRRARGIADDTCLVMYGTINPAILPHEFAIVRQLADALRWGVGSRRTHLWIRLHPQTIKGPFKQSIEPYRTLASLDITVEEPPVQSSVLHWDLPREDALHLANLLTASDVVVSPGSTLMIDAACTDTPTVTVLFDGPKAVPAELSVQRFAKYTHYEKLLSTGGVALARDVEECSRLIGSYRANPDLHREGRAAVVRQQLRTLDGRAGRRTAETLLQLTGGVW
jgi:hypothetical protein